MRLWKLNRPPSGGFFMPSSVGFYCQNSDVLLQNQKKLEQTFTPIILIQFFIPEKVSMGEIND